MERFIAEIAFPEPDGKDQAGVVHANLGFQDNLNTTMRYKAYEQRKAVHYLRL